MLVRGLNILLAIAIVVLLYLVTIWVLGMLGISVPADILRVCFVIIGLVAAIGALSGRFDSWWPRSP